MSNEELEQEELEVGVNAEDDMEDIHAASDDSDTEDDEDDNDDEDTEGDGAIDASERVTPTKKSKTAEVIEDLPTPEAKQRERDELAKAMEEFLARGGQVQAIEDNVVADPPKKPDNKYGSRPI